MRLMRGARRQGQPRRCAMIAALCFALTLAGCDAFDSERRPYTPFAVASGAASSASEPVAPAPSTVVEPDAPSREALDAPARTREWRVAGRQITAPDGLTFRMALV